MLNERVQMDPAHPVIAELQKRTNTKLTFEVPPFANYVEKVRLLFASGDTLPDVIAAIPNDMISELVEDKVIVPITKEFNATKYVKPFVDPVTTRRHTIGGEVYAIPKSSWVFANGMYVREDWLKKLNLTNLVDPNGKAVPLENLEKIATAFTLNDPDGNKANDTFGIGAPAGKTWDAYIPLIVQSAFGAGKGLMKDASGRYVNSSLEGDWNNYLEAMKYFKTLIDKGIVDPEFFTAASEQFRERFYAGKVGSAIGFGSAQSYANFIPAMQKINPEAELTWINGFIGPKGDYKVYKGGANDNGSYFVTKNCKNIKAFVDLVDYITSPEGTLLTAAGLEGEYYTLENGYPIRKTAEQTAKNTEFRPLAITLRMTRNYKSPDWYFDFPNLAPDIRKKVETFCDTSLDIARNDDIGLFLPTPDGYDIYDANNTALSQAVLKYLTSNGKEADVQTARDKHINSKEYKAYYDAVNKVYAEFNK